jgi:Icc-related predicted phosphoesterase
MRIYYASDVHGSEVCWRKFLNAGRFYRADALVMGGDIVGKAIVPIARREGAAATARWRARDVELASDSEVEALKKEIRDAGFYPYEGTTEELEYLDGSDEGRAELFERVVRHEVDRWLAIADEKHDPDVEVLVIAGNDDPWFVDDQLRTARSVTFCDRDVVDVGEVELLSLSYANRTPWNSPRELDEPELLALIDELGEKLRDPEHAVFNLHVPPYGSGLDEAPRLDETLKPITRGGQVETGPVGSTGVREAIERYQPLLSLHGHIHESRGAHRIGRTLALNPGSEYGSGRIHGALVEIKKGRIKSHQLVSG